MQIWSSMSLCQQACWRGWDIYSWEIHALVGAKGDHPQTLEALMLEIDETEIVGNGPNTVSESTVSNTELSEFFGAH